MVRKKPKKFCGVGINDADYKVHLTEKVGENYKVVWSCPIYRLWTGILTRACNESFKKRNPTYKDTTISEEWKTFSNFIRWVLYEQPNKRWETLSPDKDLLVLGNTLYSKDTVVFVSGQVNRFLNSSRKARGDLMLGVRTVTRSEKFQACCNNPFTLKSEYLGCFATQLEAHKAWQAKKHEYACQLAELQEDTRVAGALRQRYAPDKDWTKA